MKVATQGKETVQLYKLMPQSMHINFMLDKTFCTRTRTLTSAVS